MRILITADIHCGYPGRLDDNIWSLKAISDYATEHDIKHIFCLGDLFHNRDSISIDILCAIHDFFKNCDREWHVLLGNHDMFLKTSWEINSIKPLEKYAKIYDDITRITLGGRDIFMIPFMHYESEYLQKLNDLKIDNDESILFTHIGVNNAINNSCFLLKYWSLINFHNTKFKYVFTGHFHNHQIIDNKIYYPGSPIPFKFDEGMIPHGFIDFNLETLTPQFINLREIREDCPHDFITLNDDNINESLNIDGDKIRIILNREYSKVELDDIRENIIGAGASSVQWTKHDVINESCSAIIDEIDLNKSAPFLKWIGTQNCSKYNMDLLMNLYDEIANEAEDLFIQSQETQEI